MSRSAAADLLVELGTEELPYAAQAPLALALANGLEQALRARGLAPADAAPYWGPRRLAVIARAVPPVEPDRAVERRGPSLQAAFDAAGRPTRAARGFARSLGVDVADLQTLRGEAGDAWLVHRYTEKGRPTPAVLAEILPSVFAALPLPKRMRWGAGDEEFLRPVRWLLVRLGTEVVPVQAFGLTAGGDSYGHRVHHPGAVAVRRPADYPTTLRKAKVIADAEERFVAVRDMVDTAARELGASAAPPSPELYTEIAGMVEWPAAVTGSFDPRFLDLHDPVVVTTLARHQRCVPLRDANGILTNRFVAVVNLESRDPDAVRHGLERVVRPRLEDALFYYSRDVERPLAAYAEELEGLAFAPKLGSMRDKSLRLERLAGIIAEAIAAGGGAVRDAQRAGELAKCDLVTGMVFEFPELQGLMGGIYARATDGVERPTVAEAIQEQYLPAGPDDSLPRSVVGRALALADRLDTLVGCFAAGLEPTGTKDPFGLRRAAFGILRIAAEKHPHLDLEPLLQAAAEGYPQQLQAARALAAVVAFLRERLRSLLLERGCGADVAHAVLAVAPLAPGEVVRRAEALATFRTRPEAEALAAANKRIANILRQAGGVPAGATGRAGGAEAALAEALARVQPAVEAAVGTHDFGAALTALAGLRAPVDRFFDEVLVMDPDAGARARRLALLADLRAAFLRIADVGELQGAGTGS